MFNYLGIRLAEKIYLDSIYFEMSSKPRGQIRSTQYINHIDAGSSGNIEFGLYPITNKPAAVRLFMHPNSKAASILPKDFSTGYRKPSYPGMRLFA